MAELLSTMAEVTLAQGFIVKFEAIDPVTGAPITGVVVSEAAVQANVIDTTQPEPPVQTSPLWVPVPTVLGT